MVLGLQPPLRPYPRRLRHPATHPEEQRSLAPRLPGLVGRGVSATPLVQSLACPPDNGGLPAAQCRRTKIGDRTSTQPGSHEPTAQPLRAPRFEVWWGVSWLCRTSEAAPRAAALGPSLDSSTRVGCIARTNDSRLISAGAIRT